VGLAGGVSLAFILESRDNTVHSLEQAQMITALPSLAVIPLASGSSRSLRQVKRRTRTVAASAASLQPKSQIAEAYRALRTSILLSRAGQSAKVLMVTSALPQEGKTTTSVNLAIVLAQREARVLLIEGDMRRAGVSQIFDFDSDIGLSTVLGGNTAVEAAIRSVPGVPNLSVLPAGPVPANPSEMLASARMKDLLASLDPQFDYIIIDTPPALSVTDAVLLSKLADSTLLVIRAGVTSKAALRRVYDVLAQVDAHIMGVILNAADLHEPDAYYYGSRYRGYYDDSTPVRTAHLE
jgi:capsular exopolysaccharide synthesis family protein